MSYTKQTWTDGVSEANAARLGHIEDGVEDAAAVADSAVQPGDLAAVATSGSYGDLSGTPTIPDSPGDIGAAAADHGHATGDVTGLDTALDGKVGSATINTIVALTQAAYDGLTPSADTLYLITDA